MKNEKLLHRKMQQFCQIHKNEEMKQEQGMNLNLTRCNALPQSFHLHQVTSYTGNEWKIGSLALFLPQAGWCAPLKGAECPAEVPAKERIQC